MPLFHIKGWILKYIAYLDFLFKMSTSWSCQSLEDAREHDQEFTAMQADSTAEPESEGESLIIEPTLYMEQSEELRDGDIYSFLEGSG